jgi:hypothetical protein
MLYIGLCGFETARSYEKYLAVTPFTWVDNDCMRKTTDYSVLPGTGKKKKTRKQKKLSPLCKLIQQLKKGTIMPNLLKDSRNYRRQHCSVP